MSTSIPAGAPMGPPPVPVRPSIMTEGLAAPSSAPSSAGGRSLRKRNTSLSKDSPYAENDDFDSPSERAMRSANRANLKPWTPKLKLKVSSAADNRNQSFLGPYDRELDSEDEDLVFEEQFILRLPPGKDTDKLREVVSKRGVSNDIWLKFKDSRRAVFHMSENLYPAKLVDLPCIVESQKTLDNKHMFKVSDICQMILVDEVPIPNEEAALAKKSFNANEFIYPHGLTPPLRHVRNRRFRKRLNRQAIENVENEVDRLLAEDRAADQVEDPIIIEDADPNASDSEFMDPVPVDETMESEEESAKDQANDDDLFAQELEKALQGDSEEDEEDDDEEGDEDDLEGAEEGDEDDEDEDDDDESVSGSGTDEDEDDEEYSGAKKVLDDEIKQLETAINKKNQDIAAVQHVALKNRFINAVQKMQADLQTKLAQREQLLADHRALKERAAAAEDGLQDGEEEDGEDLFDEPMEDA